MLMLTDWMSFILFKLAVVGIMFPRFPLRENDRYELNIYSFTSIKYVVRNVCLHC
jgi:hypothetical protein